jgi:TolB-like protein
VREYYLTEGRKDPVIIDLPKGTYTPVFRTATTEAINRESQDATGTGATVGPIIAVLPILGTGGPDEDAFCTGVADEVITALVETPGIRVFAGAIH